MTMIALTNGPWSGKAIPDGGKVTIRMGIATKWTLGKYGWRPALGAKAGCAVYEPNEDRTRAFWSHNEWDGRVSAISEA